MRISSSSILGTGGRMRKLLWGKILTATSDSLEIYMLCCSAFQVLLTVPSMLKRPTGKITIKRATVYTVN